MDTSSQIELPGHVENGVVVLEGEASLPEGAAVTVLIAAPMSTSPSPLAQTKIVREPGKLPFVHGGAPGLWNLTDERIAEILDEEDRAQAKGMWIDPS